MQNLQDLVTTFLKRNSNLLSNASREKLIYDAVAQKFVMPLNTGTLATWTPPHSTGRSPKDTYIVRHKESEAKIDWSSANCIPMGEDVFQSIFQDAMRTLSEKRTLYSLNRVVGADSRYALPILTISGNPLSALFVDNMFRPVPKDISRSIFADRPFFLLALPYNYLDADKYAGKLRKMDGCDNSSLCVAMDFDARLGIVYGSAYLGSLKKLIFTVMNYYLPDEGILPLHCSANEGPDGACALLLGLSGTGKTTLSADPDRALIGDDEHGWSDHGVANFENGCYAKLINLNPQKEPEIFWATFHPDHYLKHGALVENLMVYPDGTFNFNDDRLTQNSRASYPLRYNSNVKESAVSGHPKTILFLAADAYGVLPPIAKLTPEQAMFWFIMGYTSKLAGTETGVTEPQATFSRFFGGPFMPRLPKDYADLLGEKMKQHQVKVYAINTGWSGGPYGVGSRIDINLTRAIVNAALQGALEQVEFERDPVFKVLIPKSCPDVPAEMLKPINTWSDKQRFHDQANRLARLFQDHFNKNFAGKVVDNIATECPISSAP